MAFVYVPVDAESTDPGYLGSHISTRFITKFERFCRNQLTIHGRQIVQDLIRLRYCPPGDSHATIIVADPQGETIYHALIRSGRNHSGILEAA